MTPSRRADARAVATLTLVWVASALLINPIGEFPLNDDWAYAWTVKTLLETGEFRLSDWAGMNLVSQALWGWLFCLPFGFSFTALRVSTLVLGWIGALATFGVLRDARAGPLLALLGSLVVAVNPLYLSLSHSFNSDVPAFAFSMASVFCLLRGLRSESWRYLGCGILLSLLSVLNRQSGVVVLAGFAAAVMMKRGWSLRAGTLAVLPLLSAFALDAGYVRWLAAHNAVPWLHGYHLAQLVTSLSGGPGHLFSLYGHNLLTMAVYIGLLLSPFVLLCGWRVLQSASRRGRWLAFVLLIVSVGGGGLVLSLRGTLPYVGNVLTTDGIGPALEGYQTLLSAGERRSLARLWRVLTMVGASCALLGLLLAAWQISRRWLARSDRLSARWGIVFHLTTIAGYLAAIAGLEQWAWFDRYLLFPLPMLMAVAVLAMREGRDVAVGPAAAAGAGVGLLLAAGLSIAVVRDYVSSNRARWAALDTLMTSQGVTPDRIDGGFEFNGWFSGNDLDTCNPGRRQRSGPPAPDWSDFTCVFAPGARPYRIAFVQTDGYVVAHTVAVRRWLPWRSQTLYVLKRFDWPS